MWSLQPQQLCLSSEEELQLDAVHAIASDYVCIQSTATCDMFIWIFFLCVEGEGRGRRPLVVLTAHTAASWRGP